MSDRKQIVRDAYSAFAAGDRSFYEQRLSDDFMFSAPPDPKLDRDRYFDRCWPGAVRGQRFDFVRLIESGDEVVALEMPHSKSAVSLAPDSSAFGMNPRAPE